MSRPPPASLLRPPRRSGRRLLARSGLVLASLAVGLVLGLSLRPGSVPGIVPPDATLGAGTPQAGVSMGPPDSAPPAQDATLRTETEALRRARMEEQARLEAATAARLAAEAQLAALQRDLAARATRREAAPPAPAQAQLGAPPTVLRLPRAEPAATSAQPRIVLHHRPGPAATEAAATMAAQVREAGFEVADVRTVAAAPSQRVVRYFHAEDAPTAARLAGRLGRGWAIQDFRAYEPLPQPGTLEVWLPER
ncbi:hypothetical protein [Siccirubricoccus sp. G192]|uniref:hypothetical protein n=1 Tax=Siccirubricoccus sp. G192 TaxID=2849651 RepID=UPI001C2BE2D9|nr:hypothetical protein [Siccirubricoccus sp. G192]MBV1799589.1 hypothetical protein [Siccirubricoccus sp. G192]